MILKMNESFSVTKILIFLWVCDVYIYINIYVIRSLLYTAKLIQHLQYVGTTFFSPEAVHGGNYSNFPGLVERPLTSRLLAVPAFKKELDNLVYNLTRDLVNTKILLPRINDLYTFLEQDVAWDKSLPRVGNNGLLSALGVNFTFDQLPFMFGINGTIPDSPISNFTMGIKNWIELRSTNLLTFINETRN
jgi:hypothetical protein